MAEEKGSTHIDPKEWESDNCMVIKMSGDKTLFVEFGAGIAFSSPPNPKAAEMGYGLGTYPSKHPELRNAYREEGWWYTDKDTGDSKHSRGNAPYMPMYKASVEIKKQVRSIAKEVFGG